jgi:hypothetical protein
MVSLLINIGHFVLCFDYICFICGFGLFVTSPPPVTSGNWRWLCVACFTLKTQFVSEIYIFYISFSPLFLFEKKKFSGQKNICILCEISSSHGGEYDVQSCLLGCTVDNHLTRQYNPEDSSEHMLNDSVPALSLFHPYKFCWVLSVCLQTKTALIVGVAGTDIPVEDIKKLLLPHKVSLTHIPSQ